MKRAGFVASATRAPRALLFGLVLMFLPGATLLSAQTRAAFLAETPDSFAIMEASQRTFRRVVQDALPTVVEINVVEVVQAPAPSRSLLDSLFGRNPTPEPPAEQRRRGLGSGFIVHQDGETTYVATNKHVIGNAQEITVRMHDGNEFTADLVGNDPYRDLALVRFDSTDELPLAALGDSDEVQPGDWAFAVGNPLGYDSTVTMGIVSAVNRPGRGAVASHFTDYIQTDAAINRGNSGGPLLNLYGEVVGINTWIAASPNGGGNIGLGFAIPINNAKRAIEDLIVRGSVQYGWLGINTGRPLPGSLLGLPEDSDGAVVYDVLSDSPGARAGILPGDLITRIDGRRVRSTEDVTRIIGNVTPGSTVAFELFRYGEPRSLRVRIGSRLDAENGTKRLWPGLAVVGITEEIRTELNLHRTMGDVVVSHVLHGGPAAIAGLRPGDIVRKVGGQHVHSVHDFYRNLNESEGREVTYRIYRQESEILIGMSK